MKTFARVAELAVILLLGGALGLSCNGTSEVATQNKSQKPSDTEDTPTEKPAACLDCHGPFEDLTAKAPSFTIEDGSQVNPHRYVPHDSKTIPECAYCHEAHPFPPEEAVKRPSSISYCFSCHHHGKDFAPCKSCHPEM
ncbi:MAG: cytochrome c3 family protein [bacterium]